MLCAVPPDPPKVLIWLPLESTIATRERLLGSAVLLVRRCRIHPGCACSGATLRRGDGATDGLRRLPEGAGDGLRDRRPVHLQAFATVTVRGVAALTESEQHGDWLGVLPGATVQVPDWVTGCAELNVNVHDPDCVTGCALPPKSTRHGEVPPAPCPTVGLRGAGPRRNTNMLASKILCFITDPCNLNPKACASARFFTPTHDPDAGNGICKRALCCRSSRPARCRPYSSASTRARRLSCW